MPFSVSREQIVAANKAIVDTFLSAINTSLNSVEKISNLNLSTARSALEAQVDSSSELLASRDPHQALAVQSALVQPQLEKLIAYSRSLYEISAQTQHELVKLLEGKHAELNKSIAGALDWYGKSAANSDIAVAAVKSAISAANSAYENINKGARQVAEIAEASVSAATSATARAVGATSQPRKKAA